LLQALLESVLLRRVEATERELDRARIMREECSGSGGTGRDFRKGQIRPSQGIMADGRSSFDSGKTERPGWPADAAYSSCLACQFAFEKNAYRKQSCDAPSALRPGPSAWLCPSEPIAQRYRDRVANSLNSENLGIIKPFRRPPTRWRKPERAWP
jgi:hypothetical protein